MGKSNEGHFSEKLLLLDVWQGFSLSRYCTSTNGETYKHRFKKVKR